MFKFNLYVSFLCIALPLLVQAGTLKDNKLKEVADACKAETGVDVADVNLCDLEKEPDEKASCFIKCTYVKLGFMNDEGKLNVDKVMEGINEEVKERVENPKLNEEDEGKLKTALEKCSDMTDPNVCLQAGKQVACLTAAQKSVGL